MVVVQVRVWVLIFNVLERKYGLYSIRIFKTKKYDWKKLISEKLKEKIILKNACDVLLK